jgi:hypothetical protein
MSPMESETLSTLIGVPGVIGDVSNAAKRCYIEVSANKSLEITYEAVLEWQICLHLPVVQAKVLQLLLSVSSII